MVSNRNFSVPKNLLTEIEEDTLDFVWNKKKHEINKQLLMSRESDGGLQLVDIQKCTTSEMASKSFETSL